MTNFGEKVRIALGATADNADLFDNLIQRRLEMFDPHTTACLQTCRAWQSADSLPEAVDTAARVLAAQIERSTAWENSCRVRPRPPSISVVAPRRNQFVARTRGCTSATCGRSPATPGRARKNLSPLSLEPPTTPTIQPSMSTRPKRISPKSHRAQMLTRHSPKARTAPRMLVVPPSPISVHNASKLSTPVPPSPITSRLLKRQTTLPSAPTTPKSGAFQPSPERVVRPLSQVSTSENDSGEETVNCSSSDSDNDSENQRPNTGQSIQSIWSGDSSEGLPDRSTASEIEGLFRSFFLKRLCFEMKTASKQAALGPTSFKQNGTLMLQGADLIAHICRKQGGLHSIREYLQFKKIIGTLVAYLAYLPRRSSGVVKILRALCSLICAGPAEAKDGSHLAEEASGAGFFTICASHLREWFDAALASGGAQEACTLVDCLGELSSQFMQSDVARTEAVDGKFVPALFDVLTEQLLAEPLVWPRALPVLMDSVETLAQPEYVNSGIELSKALRKANPNQESNMPSLLHIRMQGLKRKQQSQVLEPHLPSKPCRRRSVGQFMRGRHTAKPLRASSNSCSPASSVLSSTSSLCGATPRTGRLGSNRTSAASEVTTLPPLR